MSANIYLNVAMDNSKVYPFYKMYNSSDIDRKSKELYFITKYMPELNQEKPIYIKLGLSLL
jgi:hypothetical protein